MADGAGAGNTVGAGQGERAERIDGDRAGAADGVAAVEQQRRVAVDGDRAGIVDRGAGERQRVGIGAGADGDGAGGRVGDRLIGQVDGAVGIDGAAIGQRAVADGAGAGNTVGAGQRQKRTGVHFNGAAVGDDLVIERDGTATGRQQHAGVSHRNASNRKRADIGAKRAGIVNRARIDSENASGRLDDARIGNTGEARTDLALAGDGVLVRERVDALSGARQDVDV